jgi:Domain of unknown function (DUF4905)
MKLYRTYSFSNNRQIWRIIPGGKEKLVIEEREPETKQVFFNCIEIISGKIIFESLQFEEKFWIGIEDVYKDIIFFHKYQKPDMPWHSGIFAFDIKGKKQVWQSEEYNFLFVYDDDLYCYKNKYEGRIYFKLNYNSGELISELGDNPGFLPNLKELRDIEIYNGYEFPETLIPNSDDMAETIDYFRSNDNISGKIDYIKVNDLILINYHRIIKDGKLQNCFKALDIRLKKIIFEKILNKKITNFIPDSFFLINDLVFLLKEKDKLIVFLIND